MHCWIHCLEDDERRKGDIMDYNYFISSLEKSVKLIKQVLDGVSDEQSKWKPAPEKWSINEVVNHLYDEEKDDFRKRLDLTLHHPHEEWPGIDPEAWAAHDFLHLRQLSDLHARYLNKLSSPYSIKYASPG